MGGVPSKPDPAARMQVLGLGYGRTGTLSLTIALEKLLDGPVAHGGCQAFGGSWRNRQSTISFNLLIAGHASH
jgi:hypothetical protein